MEKTKQKIMKLLKKAVVLMMVTILLMQCVGMTIQYAFAASTGNYDMLGTSGALGSPVLNNNFQYDDWNKWEAVCWGVFLSNFTTPLIDDYASAFTNGESGSKGSGFKALKFGSGSDATNDKTIEDLTTFAIMNQKEAPSTLYVAFTQYSDFAIVPSVLNADGTPVTDGETDEDPIEQEEDEDATTDVDTDGSTENDGGTSSLAGEVVGDYYGIRPAKLEDFFFYMSENGEAQFFENLIDGAPKGKDFVVDSTWAFAGDGKEANVAPILLGAVKMGGPSGKWFEDNGTYTNFYGSSAGNLPTFYIKNGTTYERVFDYTNGWDLNMMSAWLAKVAATDLVDEFVKTFNTMWDSRRDIQMGLDCFGNIVAVYDNSNRILVPAACNQWLTDSPKRNLLNSMVFNGIVTSMSSNELVLRAVQQQNYALRFEDKWLSGIPAFGGTGSGVPDGTVMLYYDTDSIYLDNIGYNDMLYNTDQKDVSDVLRNKMRGKTGEAHLGEVYLELFNTELGNSKYPLKLELAGVENLRKRFVGLKTNALEGIMDLYHATSVVTNQSRQINDTPMLTTLKFKDKDLELLGSPRVVPVGFPVGVSGKKVISYGAYRLFMDWTYQAYKKGSTTGAGTVNQSVISDLLKSSSANTTKGTSIALLRNGDKMGKLAANFIIEHGKLFELTVSESMLLNASVKGKKPIAEKDLNNAYTALFDTNAESFFGTGHYEEYWKRLTKVYPASNVTRTVSNIMGIKEGTEFAVYSPYIYLTYLDWYGIIEGSNRGTGGSEFNTRIFTDNANILNKDVRDIVNAISEADKKKAVLNYSYLILHPTAGREYRNELVMTGITEWIYKTYGQIVYGDSTSYNSGVSDTLTTRNASGFLNVVTYSDNFMTSWFMKIYAKIAIILLGICAILIIIMGLLKHKKLSWFLLTFIVVINSILLVPTFGEITPYVANNMVQSMFADKMTFWGIAEAIEISNVESGFLAEERNSSGYMSNLSNAEKELVADMVKSFNILYIDRALMIRHDISKKVSQTAVGNFAEVQKFQSARWMLPIIMRQFSANNAADVNSYVFIPLADMYDNLTNLYLMYKPEAAGTINTITGQQTQSDSEEEGEYIDIVSVPIKTTAEKRLIYPDYIEIDAYNASADSADGISQYGLPDMGYRAVSRAQDDEELSYTSFYFMNDLSVPRVKDKQKYGSYSDSSWDEAVALAVLDTNIINKFKTSALFIEENSEGYNMADRGTMQPHFGYLWATENPYHYFYQVVKDSTEVGGHDIGLGKVASDIQGRYVVIDDGNGNDIEVRSDSLMYRNETGLIKDYLDFEEMFHNMIPYLYETQIIAGGFNGTNGVLGDAQIEKYSLYKGANQSWLFRSNWVTKIMENKDLTDSNIVYDKDGNKYTVENPTIPSAYPPERPMVFSEAQMVEQGLNESQLSLIEGKLLNINRDVARRWTLLLNYAGTRGMTKEVMQRQMATEAVLAFGAEFSPNTMLNSARAMYPSGLDLRAISFDSVMKMLMINVTKDTGYIYGDTMKGIIENSDIFTSFLLLACAFLCAYLIPLIRTLTMGLIFYLGFVSMIYNILSSNKQKAKSLCGTILSHIVFLAATLVFYAVFGALMSITASDNVLTVSSVQVSIGNPVWCFIVIIGVCIVYIWGLFKLMALCIKNYRDMGMEMYKSAAQLVSTTIGAGLTGLGAAMGIGAMKNRGGDTYANSISGSGNRADATTNVSVQDGDLDVDVSNDRSDSNRNRQDEALMDDSASGYTSDTDEGARMEDPTSIDSEIDEGKSSLDEDEDKNEDTED